MDRKTMLSVPLRAPDLPRGAAKPTVLRASGSSHHWDSVLQQVIWRNKLVQESILSLCSSFKLGISVRERTQGGKVTLL